MKIFLIFSILFLILEGCSGGKQNAEIANKELFNLDEAFVPRYKVVKTEDISYKERGVKISRILYRIVFPKGLSSTEIYDNFKYLTKKNYEENGIRNISIFAYYPDDDINNAYTIGMFEIDLAQDDMPKLVIADSYFKAEKALIEKGNFVVLNTKTEYDTNTRKFIETQRTKISNNPSDFNDCDYVPNGTEAKVTDIFSKRLTSDYTWVSYKVYISKLNKEVWVSDDCVTKK